MLASRSTLRQTTAEYCTCKSRNEIECEADKTGLRPGETVPQVNVNGVYVRRNRRNRHRPKVITRRRGAARTVIAVGGARKKVRALRPHGHKEVLWLSG